MVNVPKWHHLTLWEICILIYSLIVLIFIRCSYVDHRSNLLLFIQIIVECWWTVVCRIDGILLSLNWEPSWAGFRYWWQLGSKSPQMCRHALWQQHQGASGLTAARWLVHCLKGWFSAHFLNTRSKVLSDGWNGEGRLEWLKVFYFLTWNRLFTYCSSLWTQRVKRIWRCWWGKRI